MSHYHRKQAFIAQQRREALIDIGAAFFLTVLPIAAALLGG